MKFCCFSWLYQLEYTICIEKKFLCFSYSMSGITQLYMSIYNWVFKRSQGGRCPTSTFHTTNQIMLCSEALNIDLVNMQMRGSLYGTCSASLNWISAKGHWLNKICCQNRPMLTKFISSKILLPFCTSHYNSSITSMPWILEFELLEKKKFSTTYQTTPRNKGHQYMNGPNALKLLPQTSE